MSRILSNEQRKRQTPGKFYKGRSQRTFTVGVLVPELSDGYHTLVMSGIGDHLMREGYFYFSAHHRHKPDMIGEYPRLLMGRGAGAAGVREIPPDFPAEGNAAAKAEGGEIGIPRVRLADKQGSGSWGLRTP